MKRHPLLQAFLLQILIILLLPAIHSCSKAEHNILPPNLWASYTYRALNKVITENGKDATGYDPECRPYAVFDFDNTTIINDIEETTQEQLLPN